VGVPDWGIDSGADSADGVTYVRWMQAALAADAAIPGATDAGRVVYAPTAPDLGPVTAAAAPTLATTTPSTMTTASPAPAAAPPVAPAAPAATTSAPPVAAPPAAPPPVAAPPARAAASSVGLPPAVASAGS